MLHINVDRFDQLYYQFNTEIFSFVYKKVHCSYMAEEVVQLTFIKFWKVKDRLSDEVEIRPQLFQIAKTVLIDQLRKKYSQKNRVHITVEENELSSNVEISSNLLAHQVDYNDARARIERLLIALPPMRKKVFVLSRFEEYTHKEIANLLNISTKTIENHITQALRYLKLNWCFLLMMGLGVLGN